MTREEAKGYLTNLKHWKFVPDNLADEALDMAIKALEQEPILDKIRAEIADIYCSQYCENPYTAAAVRKMALDIIDKYKASPTGAESEVQNEDHN